MIDFENKLKENLKEYHQVLQEPALEIYQLYKNGNKNQAAELFLKTIFVPRKTFLEILGQKGLNYGSSAGFINEWIFYHLINTLITTEKLTNIVVKNNEPIDFKWKKEGHKKIKVDICVKSEKPKRILYCIEIKTNFDDGFSNYLKQEKQLYHHRSRHYKDFRYHYIAFSNIPNEISKKFKRKLKTLERRKELWELPDKEIKNSSSIKLNPKLIEKGQNLLSLLYEPLLKSKNDS